MSTRAVAPVVAGPVAVLTPLQRPMLQRTCDCGQHTGGGECEECNKKKKIPLQRHPNGQAAPAIAPPIVHDVLRSPGQPLDDGTQTYFASRFGHNFSQVRVHTDQRAAESAQAVRALAYTVGNNVVFGAGRYSPADDSGRQLLAHELTHVAQQDESTTPTVDASLEIGRNDDAFEREAESVESAVLRAESSVAGTSEDLRSANRTVARTPRLSRKENKDEGVRNKKVDELMKKIQDKLTSFFFNLFVTEKDVHEVLQLLKPLSASDLLDAVERMEEEGLVDRLFKHVSDSDKENEAQTLQGIQNSRVQKVSKVDGGTVTVQGSCSIADNQAIEGKVGTTKGWAKKAKDTVNDFVSDPAAHAATGALLDKHFFHQANNPPGLDVTQQKNKAQTIRANFEKVEQQANPLLNRCASPVDTECTALAAAYVPADKLAVMFCRSFFSEDANAQTYMLFHELTHVYANVEDRGYGNERVFAHLSPDLAIDNADSYALFATDTGGIAKGAAGVRGSAPKDDISDCDPQQKKAVEHDFAFGSRMVIRALGALGETNPNSMAMRQGWLTTHFKTSDPEKLTKVRERYQTLRSALDGSINFECERTCKANVLTYYYKIFGTTVHICPPFFARAGDEQVDTLLTGVVAEELGLKSTAASGTAAYAGQSVKEAIDNADSYAGYAREVTKIWGV
jgi:hypothetical protein